MKVSGSRLLFAGSSDCSWNFHACDGSVKTLFYFFLFFNFSFLFLFFIIVGFVIH